LTGALDLLRDTGMTVAEGYPRADPPADPEFPWSAANYHGTPAMFEGAGFHLDRRIGQFLVMRKAL
jgi:hypothetical protein